MLSTNIAEAMPNDSTLTNMDVTQSMTNNIVTTQTVNVNNFNDLKQYKDTSDITIEISGNITLDEKIEMTGSNVVINGNGFEIDINENKTKLEKKLHSGALRDYVEDYYNGEVPEQPTVEYKIARTKKVPVKPMHIEEAILQMDMLGHQFYMFRDAETEEIAVVYKRHNGGYGLLEPDEDDE